MPNWYSYQKNMLLNSTTMGISSYQINVIGLDETYQTLELDIKPKCLREPYHIVARLCVPWTKGFERFYHFTESDKGPMYIWVPINRLRGYNTTENPVRVDLTLDPDCRYTIRWISLINHLKNLNINFSFHNVVLRIHLE